MRGPGTLALLGALASGAGVAVEPPPPGSAAPTRTDFWPGQDQSQPRHPGVDEGAPLSFRFDILPLLHRGGCASAYCHGSATGRGGFKLSLFASDPRADFAAIALDRGGRRLDFVRPEHSLLLRKPTGAIRHGGGRRLQTSDPAHRQLVRWIREGAKFRSGPPLRLQGLRAARSAENQMRVLARFSQGAPATSFERDVTALCTFSSTDPSVAEVDRHGKIRNRGPGTARVFARYDSTQTWLEVGASFRDAEHKPEAAPPAEKGDRRTEAPPINALWRGQLQALGLSAAPPASSWRLARRLYLDLVGRLPRPEELRRWHALPPTQRVAATAAELVENPEFATTFGRHFARWLEIPLRPPSRKTPQTALFADIRRQLVRDLAAGADAASIARRLLVEDPRLLHRFADPRDRAELVGRALLGIRIGCARCHNSPVDRWEQSDHLGFAALFASPRPAAGGGTRPGILFDPTGDPVPPRELPIRVPRRATSTGTATARASLAVRATEFILDPEHGQFARNIANRVFATLLGRGLVEPLDDHRPTNPAVHPKILDHLAKEFPRGDLRGLTLAIVTSAVYQATSDPSACDPDGNRDAAVRFFARREAHPLSPHAFRRAIESALRVEIPTPLPESPLARQLALLNGDFIHGAIARSSVLETLDQLSSSPEAMARDLFELLLSRTPRDAELRLLRRGPQERSTSLRRLAFALLASREFGSRR